MQQADPKWLSVSARTARRVFASLSAEPVAESTLVEEHGMPSPEALTALLVDLVLTAVEQGEPAPIEAVHDEGEVAWRLATGDRFRLQIGTDTAAEADVAVGPVDASGSVGEVLRQIAHDRAAELTVPDDARLAESGYLFLDEPRVLLVRTDHTRWLGLAAALMRGLLSPPVRTAQSVWIPILRGAQSRFGFDDTLSAIELALRVVRPAQPYLGLQTGALEARVRGWFEERALAGLSPWAARLSESDASSTPYVNPLEAVPADPGLEQRVDQAAEAESVEAPAVEEWTEGEVPADLTGGAFSEAAIEQTLQPRPKAASTPPQRTSKGAKRPPKPDLPVAAPRSTPPPEPVPQPPALRLILTADSVRLVEGETEHWQRSLTWPDARTHRFAGSRLSEVRRRLPVDWSVEQVEAFGDALAAVTFGEAPPALSVFQGVRRLVIEAGRGVPDLPWEYLRLEGRFLAGLRLSIVRHVDARAEPRPLRTTEPDPIAFAAANPSDEQRFDVSHHADTIFAAVAVDRRSRLHCDIEGLRSLAEDPKIQGFHFLGHGHPRHLAVEGEPGRVEAGKLAGWLSAPERLKFVFLGACHSGAMLPRNEEGTSGVASTIACETGVPVVAMQLSVSQHYSTEFAAAFYRHFEAAGWDIEEAVYRTRRATYDTTLFGVPVLYADTKQAAVPVLDADAPVRKIEQVVVKQIAADDAAAWLQQHEAPSALIEQVKKGGALPKPDFGDPLQAIRELARAVAATANQEEQWVAESRRALAPRPADFDTLSVVIEGERELAQDWSVIEAHGPVNLALRNYAFEHTLIQRIVGELYAGRHVLLTGPVGTGKTTLARAIANALGEPPVEATAHAEWSTQDVVGGFWPQPQKDGTTQLVFRNGCVTEAILRNWVQAGDDAVWRPAARPTWLIIDELNRADMDRAMGPLFTALESRRLMVPTVSVDVGAPTRTAVQIPLDFRIIATMNTVDQHYLFRLSDALKRRFAFVEVPVVTDFADERTKLERWLARAFPDYQPAADPSMGALRDFITHARNIHSVGTAILKAAMGFIAATHGRIPDPEPDEGAVAIRLDQAIAGSVLPTLENLSAIQRAQLTLFTTPIGRLPALERLRPTDEPSLF